MFNAECFHTRDMESWLSFAVFVLKLPFFLLFMTMLLGDDKLAPPVAKPVPHSVTLHGDTREDPYFWLRDRTNPEVIRYLEAENHYTEAVMKHTEGLRKTLYDEMLGRIHLTGLS